jgi:hypothetical protein
MTEFVYTKRGWYEADFSRITDSSPGNNESHASQIQELVAEKNELERQIQRGDVADTESGTADSNLRREMLDLKLENARLPGR